MANVEVTLDRTEAMLKTVMELSKKQVLVGIPAGSGRGGSPLNNASLAYIHEFGSPARNIPARPFLYRGVEKAKNEIADYLRKAIDFASNDKPQEADQTLHALGMMVANRIKGDIVAGGDPPFARLKPATIRRKGSDKPLIDTGQMLNSITYVIRTK